MTAAVRMGDVGGPVAGPAPTAESESGIGRDDMIRAQGLGKRFRIYTNPRHRVLEWLGAGRVKRHTEFWAVRGVSLGVKRGECLGIIGANGSGKSTLLKMITGALYPTEGTARVRGRVLSLLDLGAGLNPQLTGRASVIHSAGLLGFPGGAGYARDAMPRIERFADLGDFFDRPVGLYSSGMRLRLVFSMFACFEPDVFVVDEALAVGDVFFQQKCATRLREMLDSGLTMLFVSHDHGAILNLCDRAILMERGRAVFEGDPAGALARYTASLRGKPRFGPAPSRVGPAPGAPTDGRDEERRIIECDVLAGRDAGRFGTGAARVIAVRVTDASGRDSMRAFMGEALTFHVLIEAADHVAHPRVGIQLVDRFTNLLFACGTRMLGHELPALAPGERLIVRLTVSMDLAPGEYSFAVGASVPAEEDPDQGVVQDQVPDLGPLRVMLDRGKPRPFHGAARLNVGATHTAPGRAGRPEADA